MERSESILKIEVPVSVSSLYTVVGLAHITNGCCSDRPVLITGNMSQNGTVNYSCQCSCGGWCTNAHDTASGALWEYEIMSGSKSDTRGRIISASEVRRPSNWKELLTEREQSGKQV